MKPLFGLLVIVLLGSSITACGSSSARSASVVVVFKKDRDNDRDNNDDDSRYLDYGHAPNAAERRSIVSLVTAYYAAQASADGAKACQLLMPFVAESVVEDISHSPGLQGKSCTTVMSKLFKVNHTLLSGESASLKFYSVRVSSGEALTVLSFANLPEVRQLTLRRDSGGAWRVLDLLDDMLE